MTESGISRLVGAVSYFAALAVRSPSEFRAVLRSLGACLLDLHFSYSSPLPLAGPALIANLERHPAALPAPGDLLPGNQELRGLLYLVALARLVEARVIFEIGTYNGLFALTLARNMPEAVVHTLDLPTGTTPLLDILPSDRGNLSDSSRRAYEGTPEEARIVQHFGDSAKFDFSPFIGTCDLVYIDGAHSFDYVKNDTHAAFEIVSTKGAIVWDDYWRRIPDVARYLHTMRHAGLQRLPESRLVVWLSGAAREPVHQRALTRRGAPSTHGVGPIGLSARSTRDGGRFDREP
jgi:Methyltransferase domain